MLSLLFFFATSAFSQDLAKLAMLDRVRGNQVNVVAVRDFTRRFGNPDEVSWFKTEDSFLAYGWRDGKKIIARYSRKGNWYYSTLVYPPSLLPKEVRDVIRRAWLDHTLTWVEEVSSREGSIYFVQLTDGKELLQVRCQQGGDPEVIKQLQLAKPKESNSAREGE
ncbi:hypothetical protein FPE01S_01_04880 [Flavihumibacter petaseus NBRC 106054]|uniref:Uncharacterized protein n=2 Tax=Flavihumibacter TaxID=1004301 RepID=A0A0E9MWJ2_9BACT|nr:hypothetical protein FPE01S_01_04880 [Flavihumibacter petaseus NBRC 106054]